MCFEKYSEKPQYFHWFMMQYHREQAQVEDNWICNNAHFEDVLNSKDETLM